MIDALVRPVVLAWEGFKDWLSADVHLTHHQLHAIVGLLVFAGAAKLSRRSLGSFAPLLPVALLEAANETSDYLRYRIDRWPWTPRETLVDIALTLGPPLALAVAVRLARPLRRPDGIG